jgi:hypothetical protein
MAVIDPQGVHFVAVSDQLSATKRQRSAFSKKAVSGQRSAKKLSAISFQQRSRERWSFQQRSRERSAIRFQRRFLTSDS